MRSKLCDGAFRGFGGVQARTSTTRVLATCTLAGSLFLGLLAAFVKRDADIAAAERREPFTSVLAHRDGIFAATSNGLYFTSQGRKQWARLPCDSRMPMGGTFAGEFAASGDFGDENRRPAFGPVYYLADWAA